MPRGLLAGQNLPGLIVVDEGGRPSTVLPGTQVLRMAIPAYCQDDPALARVVDEAAADVFLRGVGQRTVAELLPGDQRELPVVDPDATVLEAAAVAREFHRLGAIAVFVAAYVLIATERIHRIAAALGGHLRPAAHRADRGPARAGCDPLIWAGMPAAIGAST